MKKITIEILFGERGNQIPAGLGIPQSDASESLRLLPKNEQMLAICSGCSEGMSDRERIAQVAHKKKGKISKSLTFLSELLIRS